MCNICRWGGAFCDEIIWHYQTGRASKNWFAQKLFFSKNSDYIFESTSVRIPRTEKSLRRAQNPKDAPISSEGTTKLPMDAWADIYSSSEFGGRECLNYPTQKPFTLLECILTVSSNEGDIVVNPSCGCGTTIAVARRLNQEFVGGDISSSAVDLVLENRLTDKSIPACGIPQDLRSTKKLVKKKTFGFEYWAVTCLPGFAPNSKQVTDGGVDGCATIANRTDQVKKLAFAQVRSSRYNLSSCRTLLGLRKARLKNLVNHITLAPIASHVTE